MAKRGSKSSCAVIVDCCSLSEVYLIINRPLMCTIPGRLVVEESGTMKDAVEGSYES